MSNARQHRVRAEVRRERRHSRVVETWIIRFYFVCCCLHIIRVAFCAKSKSNVNYLIDTFLFLVHDCRCWMPFRCDAKSQRATSQNAIQKKIWGIVGRYESESLVSSVLCIIWMLRWLLSSWFNDVDDALITVVARKRHFKWYAKIFWFPFSSASKCLVLFNPFDVLLTKWVEWMVPDVKSVCVFNEFNLHLLFASKEDFYPMKTKLAKGLLKWWSSTHRIIKTFISSIRKMCEHSIWIYF